MLVPLARWLRPAANVVSLFVSRSYYVLWKQADFLGGADTQTVGFSAADLVIDSIKLVTGDTIGPGAQLRWWVQNGGSFYIADTDETGGSNLTADTTYQRTDFASLTWRQQTELSNGSRDGMMVDSGFPGGVASSSLNDVEAVGFYIFDTAKATYTTITDFEVSATAAIPEPGSLALALVPQIAIEGTPRDGFA